jgi:hypothetical protein
VGQAQVGEWLTEIETAVQLAASGAIREILLTDMSA